MVTEVSKVKIEIDGVKLSGALINKPKKNALFVINSPSMMPQKESMDIVDLARKNGIKSVLLHPYYNSIFLGLALGEDIINYMFNQGLISLDMLERFIRSKKIGDKP